MIFTLLGGRKVALVLVYVALVVANTVFDLGITPESLGDIKVLVLGYAAVEGGRDIVETYKITKPDHDAGGIDTTADAYDDVVEEV